MNKLFLVVWLFAVLQATYCLPAKHNWDNANSFPPARPSNEFEFKKNEMESSDEIAKNIIEGDIILTPVQAEIFEESGWEGLAESESWLGGHGEWPREIPYLVNEDQVRPEEQEALRQSIEMIEDATCLRFVKRTDQTDYLKFNNTGGCTSYIGKIGGDQNISLDAGCGAAVPAHEIIHALGRLHEQSRPDRDTYVRILFENIIPGAEGNFQMVPTADNQSLPYDYGSLMHYGRKDFSKNEQPTIETRKETNAELGQRVMLTEYDKMHINIRYCPERVIRLVNGGSQNEGRVEVNWKGEWGTVCDDEFDQVDGDVICKYLGYSGAREVYSGAHFGQGSGSIWFDDMRCTGSERSPFHCPRNMPIGSDNCGHDQDAGLACRSDTTSTVVPSATTSTMPPTTSTMSPTTSTMPQTTSTMPPVTSTVMPTTTTTITTTTMTTTTTTSTIIPTTTTTMTTTTSTVIPTTTTTMTTTTTSTIIPTTTTTTMTTTTSTIIPTTTKITTLTSTIIPTTTTTMTTLTSTVIPTTTTTTIMTTLTSTVIPTTTTTTTTTTMITVMPTSCTVAPVITSIATSSVMSTETSIATSSVMPTETPTIMPGSDVVRLVNGDTMHAGRVEVYIDPIGWGTVCHNSFGIEEAKVICRQLGYSNLKVARYYPSARYGEGTLPILLDDLRCDGGERDIRNCPGAPVGLNFCSHDQDVSVSCM